MAEKKRKIGTREDFVKWATEVYCGECVHFYECNQGYLCPPLDNAWEEVEDYFKQKEAKKE